jgi:hypothetical protein
MYGEGKVQEAYDSFARLTLTDANITPGSVSNAYNTDKPY